MIKVGIYLSECDGCLHYCGHVGACVPVLISLGVKVVYVFFSIGGMFFSVWVHGLSMVFSVWVRRLCSVF